MKWISLRLTGMQLDWDLISDLMTDLNFSYQQSHCHQTEIKPESRKLMERFGCYVAFKLNLSDFQNFQRICPSDWLQWKSYYETRSIPHRCTTKKYFKQKKEKYLRLLVQHLTSDDTQTCHFESGQKYPNYYLNFFLIQWLCQRQIWHILI